MATKDEEFWLAAEDWSRRKHLVVSYYLTPAAAKLRQISPDNRVIILDGFAGRGTYADGSPGSPILMGQLADRARSWRIPVDLKVFNVEPDDESFAELVSCTMPWTETGVVRNFAGTFQSNLMTILTESAQSPLFAFLDPFRPTHLLFDDFAPLLSRPGVTELCFVFHTPAVMRLLETVRPAARTGDKTRQSNKKLLTEIFGNSRWEKLLSSSLEPDEVVRCFAKELLFRRGRRMAYVLSHAIRARYRVGLKYHIVLFTRHRDGVRLTNDAFCTEAHGVYEGSARSQQMNLWAEDTDPPVELQHSDRIAVLERTLVGIGRSDPARQWKREDLVFESICRHHGDFMQKEHLQALKGLFEKKAGTRFRPLDGKVTGTGRWITNDSTLVAFEGQSTT